MRLDFYPNADLMQRYRNVFSTHDGTTVLAHMLYELGLFQEVALTPEETTLKNYASRLLGIIGGGDVKQHSIEILINQLSFQPLPKKK